MTKADPPILPWRFVVGALLHLALPAYLVTLAVVVIAHGEARLSAAVIAVALSASWQFLIAYIGLICVFGGGARAIDPVLRRRRTARESIDPGVATCASASRVTRAVSEAGDLAGALGEVRIVVAAGVLRDGLWNHADPRFQSLSADFASATAAFLTASRTVTSEQRHQIAALSAEALEQIAGELTRLSTESGSLDFGDAQVTARYIAMRYGPSDFAGEPRD